jgi:hypothetical protein
MTPVVDRDGRIFGRVNLVDALCGLFLVGLVPVAYASFLLFRPARPHITSVERSEINKEEQRIAGGLDIRLKVKVRGDHLTPMLRAFIDDDAAIGFTFESPTSADVIIGNVPMGVHDLILYDGAQEVARAPGAVAILPQPGAVMRIVGTLIQLDEATARSVRVGQRFEVNGNPSAEFLKLGDVEPDRHQIRVGTGHVETQVDGSWRRAVVMTIHCEPDPDASVCRIGMTTLGDPKLSVLSVPGAPQPLRVLVDEILPDAAPRGATVRVRVEGQPELAGQVRSGDRDVRGGAIDDRTASVIDVRRGASRDAFDLVLRVGLDRASNGWRYKAQSVDPGSPFSLATDRYSLSGSIVSVVIDEP